MRSKISGSAKNIFIVTIIVLTIYFTITVSISVAQENQLYIHISDEDGFAISEINEEESFLISIYTLDETSTPEWIINVDVEFNGIHYTIDEDAEITLQAPKIDSDEKFEIIATKEGYTSASDNITILNTNQEQLSISLPEGLTVDGGQKFSILITDEKGNPIIGALVAIENFGETKTTDDSGRQWLTAPNDQERIRIIAQKDGYEQKILPIEVNIEQPWWIVFLYSPYFPIIIAVIVLLFAIIYVNHRQKKSIYERASQISNEKTMERYDKDEKSKSDGSDKTKKEIIRESTLNDGVRTKPDQDPKVEEIRISRPRKEKEVVPVDAEEDETEKVIKRKQMQKRDYDWFEGTEDTRYEIDKLTGKIDEDGIDKWYEGVDGLKDKIDEKVKKKDKKNKEEK